MEPQGSAIGCMDEFMNKNFSNQEPSGKCRSSAAAAASPDVQQTATACFDCSICMDSAADPVVTLCGHLYCWPCIYKWMQVEDTSSPRNCPICKSPLSLKALIPLYGRGSSINTKKLDIPNKPGILRETIASLIQEEQHSSRGNNDGFIGLHRPMQHQQPHHHRHQYYPSFSWTAGGVLGGLAIGILPLVSRNNRRGDMYLSRSSQLNAYGNSASQRRQERRVEVWLHQLWVFLFCCIVLCLLFF